MQRLSIGSTSVCYHDARNCAKPFCAALADIDIIAFGLANFLFTFPAYPFIDPRGRRPLLLISLGGMALSLLVVSGCFLIPHRVERIGFVATFTIAVFTLFYSIGAGPIPFTLSAEVFPLCLRGRCPESS